MAQQTNKQSSNHSFYKEAKKSFYGSEGFSKEKTWKLTKKFTKWALYGFLTVTTLWGCVNEFIIKTGNQIGTGVEFYSSSSEVVPNMFASDVENKVVWEATGQQSIEEYNAAGKSPYGSSNDNEVQEWEGTELKPFDMATINPDFGREDITPDDDTDNPFEPDNLFIPISEEKNIGQINNPYQYGIYNLKQLNENKIDSVIIESQDTVDEYLFVPPSSAFPDGLKTIEEIGDETDEIMIPGIDSWSEFYVDKLNNGELYDPNKEPLSPDTNGKGEDIEFSDPNTAKYFTISQQKIKDENGDETDEYEDAKIEPIIGWYAMPKNINDSKEIDDPKESKWQIVADITMPFSSTITPEISKNENGEIEEIVKVTEDSINTYATNTAIAIANEIAYYTGEIITFNDTIGEFLGMVGDEDPILQIKKQEENPETEEPCTYQEFYDLVKDNSLTDETKINKNSTISDIAKNSTFSYMEQFTTVEDGDFDDYYPAKKIKCPDDIDIIGDVSEEKGGLYEADYKKLLTSNEAEDTNGGVYFGQAYVVSNVTSKKPTIPTYDALYTMQGLRPTNWTINKNDLRNSKKLNDIYVDPLAQQAGWGLLDENGNLQVIANDKFINEYYIIQQVYDDPKAYFYDEDGKTGKNYVYGTEAYDGVYYGGIDENGDISQNSSFTEEQYYEALEPLFAMQRTSDWEDADQGIGDVSPPTESACGNEKKVDQNFDQMIFNYTNKGENIEETYTSYFESTFKTTIYKESDDEDLTKINEKKYEIAYATPIAGISANTKISGDKGAKDIDDDPNEVRKGTTTPVSWTNDPIDKTSLDSSLYNSNSKGIDEGNTSRGIFAGWGDWGWAWNIKFGPLYGLFLFPISQIALFVQHVIFPFHIFGAWGVLLGVFFIVFFLRGVGSLMSFKSTSNQQKMQEVQVEVAKINAKYEKYGDNKQMKQRKQMEVMALYRKKEINPLGSFGTIFITMPIFISMWILISAIPVYKVAAIGKFSFSVSALSGIFSSLFVLYLLVGISVGLMQGVSAKLPGWLAQKRKGIKQVTEAEKKAQKKQNKTQNIMVGVFIVIGLTVPVLLAFYWISSAIFTISLELGRHKYQIKKGKKVKQEK